MIDRSEKSSRRKKHRVRSGPQFSPRQEKLEDENKLNLLKAGALNEIDGKLKKPDALASSATKDEVKKHKEQSDLFCKANSYTKSMITNAVTDTMMSTHIAKLKSMWHEINNGLNERKEHPLPDLMIVCKVLNILPRGFSSFQSSWMMLTDSIKKTLDELVIQLCAYGRNFLKVASSNSVVQEALQVKHTSKKTQGKPFKSKVKKGDVCNYCKLEGHWIYQCPKWTADGKPKRSESAAATDASILLVGAKAFSVEGDSATWWVDNGATKHVSNSIEYFTEFYKFESPCGVTGAGKEILPANGKAILQEKRSTDGTLYKTEIQPQKVKVDVNIVNISSMLQLYHDRWDHQDRRHVRVMLQREMGINVPLVKDLCEPCIYGKAYRLPFGQRTSASKPGKLVSASVCGPFSESFGKKRSKIGSQRLSSICQSSWAYCKRILSDNGGELDNKDIRDMLQAEGITQRLTAPYTSEQNGGSEREFRTCIKMARTFKYLSSEASFPEALWAELVATATYILNKTGKSSKGGVSPYELWTGKKTRIKHLRIIGSVCYAHIPAQKRRKMDTKAIKGKEWQPHPPQKLSWLPPTMQ
ncbi:hypothetical protein ILUMI_03613 [Ignelater luminosus]|uniref:Integrase catalytic domain-containing protein n=1 Tax=Ignelater luminosus TaxID=2038154 RepID=A0A8K0DB81_IGNLU|nr:hypothetical protein ILUMI_03613 [Ignelater luminosus]